MKALDVEKAITIFKKAGTPLWDAAQSAVVIAAWFEFFWGVFMLGIAGVLFYGVWKKDWDEVLSFAGICFIILGLILFCAGGYELLTLDYQTYKVLLP